MKLLICVLAICVAVHASTIKNSKTIDSEDDLETAETIFPKKKTIKIIPIPIHAHPIPVHHHVPIHHHPEPIYHHEPIHHHVEPIHVQPIIIKLVHAPPQPVHHAPPQNYGPPQHQTVIVQREHGHSHGYSGHSGGHDSYSGGHQGGYDHHYQPQTIIVQREEGFGGHDSYSSGHNQGWQPSFNSGHGYSQQPSFQSYNSGHQSSGWY